MVPHAGAYVPPLLDALPGALLCASPGNFPGALPLLGTLLVIAVAVLSRLVERKVGLLVVAVRGCEWRR